MDQTLLIYKDEGVSIPSYMAIQWMLFGLPYTLSPINAEQLAQSNWEHNCAALFFPGGRDIPYHKALKGMANAKIRSYVERGGCYVGICAGGYYASHIIEFERGNPHEVLAERDLKFFEGKAVGTLFGSFEYDSESGACHTPIRLDNEVHSLYYNGGCYFDVDPTHSNVEVLGRYQQFDEKAAIIQCSVGKGNALLSGVHYEFPSKERPTLVKMLIERLL